MLVLTGNAVLTCEHGGIVVLAPQQHWVRIGGRDVLVEGDPLHRPIAACPMTTPTTPPCLLTISVNEAASYSPFITIATKGDKARRLCVADTTGKTDWSKLASVPFSVRAPGQDFVSIGGRR
ncbi:hypothetical protein [Bradyrhizobium sp. SZCCHNS3051]|uniref:hypothetical protein n=1 Tax=Bradyrhizobium sp. SZCCHNS3051 TaxID=3057320 RepID=UPI0029160D87|nr:hypothetical protein [Bradyrhizobium sp. SZCCHNS3051]